MRKKFIMNTLSIILAITSLVMASIYTVKFMYNPMLQNFVEIVIYGTVSIYILFSVLTTSKKPDI
jgi:uncharacterized membrane protein